MNPMLLRPVISTVLMLIASFAAMQRMGHNHFNQGLILLLLAVVLLAAMTRQLTIIDRSLRRSIIRHPAGKALGR